MAAVPPLYTVHDNMVICGINDVNLFQGRTQAQRIASELFTDEFRVVMNISNVELNEGFTTLASMTAAQGQIKLMPAIKTNIRAFIQWCKDESRMGRNPAIGVFPIADAADLILRMKKHDQFIETSKTKALQTIPQQFTNDVQWEDWAPTFIDYLRTIPGSDGVPLSYVIRANEERIPTTSRDFLDEYVAMASLDSDAFHVDNIQVLRLTRSFVVGNTEAEAILQSMNERHGRNAFLALKTHYEGEGLHAVDIMDADRTIHGTFYTGEKPTMNWSIFERRLKKAYAAYDKDEGREVHSDNMKLRNLQSKITAPFLQLTKGIVDGEIAKRPMVITFPTAMRMYRTAVREKFPQGTNNSTDRGRQMSEANARDNNHDRSRSRNGKSKHRDEEEITLSNGNKIWYHPSYRFSDGDLRAMTEEQRDRMKNERAAYRRSQGRPPRTSTRAQIAEMRAEMLTFMSSAGTTVPNEVPAASGATQVSQITTGTARGSAIGGRNQQTNAQSGRRTQN